MGSTWSNSERLARWSRPLGLALATTAFLGAAAGCSDDITGPQTRDYEWVIVTYGDNIPVSVAVFRPEGYSDTGNHPVIVALPWGGGTPDLTLGMVDAYWSREASRRGYIVVAPSIRGSSLGTEASEFVPALFAWMNDNLSFDMARVAVVGASNGGRGAFHMLASAPDRFAAVIGMPGMYSGPSEALAPFAGKPAWLMAGEADTSWRESMESTATLLESVGIMPRVDVISGQGHVLQLDDRQLMDWLDEALGER